MIKLNLEYSKITEEQINGYKDQVKTIHESMEEKTSEGNDFLGWMDLPEQTPKQIIKDIKQKAKELTNDGVELLVVIGIGGSFAGAKAGIEMVNGEYPTNKGIEVMFVGESVSSTNMAQKLKYAENKNFAINVISKSGTTTEPALAFRFFRKLLEEKVGVNNSAQYIIATTDANKGALKTLSEEKGYTTFVIPDDVGGRFSVLTPVGLFPLQCAGIDIEKIMDGAKDGNATYRKSDLENNDAYRYAVSRVLLNKSYPSEMMIQYEPQMKAFSEWWKQLAGESEGKNEKGLLPTSAVFSTDLHSLGQFIQSGSKVLFETVMHVRTPNVDMPVLETDDNLDNLNYLAPRTVHKVNGTVLDATLDAHSKIGKVPNIIIEFDKMDAHTFGELVMFFEWAVAMTAYLLGVNPFNQPGVEIYKQNMFKLLGKPE